MIRIEHELVVDRPLEDVFAYVTDPANVPEWQSGVLETTKEPEERLRAGTRWREVRTFLGRRMEGTLEATAYEPGAEFSLRALSGPLPFEVRHLFERAGGATRIRVVAEGEPAGFARFGQRFVARAAERQLKGDFARLKRVLEDRPPS